MDASPIAVKVEPKYEAESVAPPRLPPTTQLPQVTPRPVVQPSLAEQLQMLGQLRKDGLLNESQHRRATEITLEAYAQHNALVGDQLQLLDQQT
jgi:hypothetical protein